MSRRYEFSDVQRVNRTLDALVPEGVKVVTTLVEDGYGLVVTVCGAKTCANYSFGPGATEHNLLKVAEQWKTGEQAPLSPSFDPQMANGTTRFINTKEELIAWVRTAKKGERVIYFHGELAQARYDMPRQRVAIMARSDALPPGKTLEPFERVRLQKISETLEMLEAIGQLQSSNLIEPVQLRMTDGTGYTYYAARK
jgi:hypothetical protein